LEAKDGLDGRVVIVGMPWDGSSSFRRGMRHAPDAIRMASHSLESYSHIFRLDLRGFEVADLGNMLLPQSHEGVIDAISSLIFKLHSQGKRTVCIGGDHSVTVGIVDGLLKAYKELRVIVFDAHSDWRDEYDGSRLSHACTVRRLTELVGIDNVLVFGARSFVGDEPMGLYRDISELPWLVTPNVPTHISIDLDVLDPSIISAVSNPEPNGLHFHELVGAIQKLRIRGCCINSVDVVELCPQLDFGTSAIVAARLIVECILGLLLSTQVG